MATSSSTRRMIGGIEETSASFEARSAPRSYPTPIRHRRLAELEPQLEQLTMDPRGAPQWVLLAHSSDQIA